MANTKSSKKRAQTNEVSRQHNVARRSEIKTTIKSFLAAIEEKNFDAAKEFLKVATSKISRAVGKGVFKKNRGSRKISRLTRKLTATSK